MTFLIKRSLFLLFMWLIDWRNKCRWTLWKDKVWLIQRRHLHCFNLNLRSYEQLFVLVFSLSLICLFLSFFLYLFPLLFRIYGRFRPCFYKRWNKIREGQKNVYSPVPISKKEPHLKKKIQETITFFIYKTVQSLGIEILRISKQVLFLKHYKWFVYKTKTVWYKNKGLTIFGKKILLVRNNHISHTFNYTSYI